MNVYLSRRHGQYLCATLRKLFWNFVVNNQNKRKLTKPWALLHTPWNQIMMMFNNRHFKRNFRSEFLQLSADKKCGIWIILNLKLHLPLYDLKEIVLENFFSETNFYSVRENRRKILCTQQTRSSLLSRRNGTAHTANVKKSGNIVVTWSLLPFTFHVNEVPNLSNEIGNASRLEVRRGI